jgi:phage tail-like protein
MAFSFLKHLWSKLPDYFHVMDSYRENDPEQKGRGLLQRYLLNFEQEYDQDIYPFIRDFVNILDPEITPEKFLPFLAYTLGDPVDVDGTKATYRKILRYAVAIYKIKGTIPSYKLLFNLLGLDVDIIEYEPPVNIKFDREFKYDIPGIKYDQFCNVCGEYSVAYHDRGDDCSTFTVNPVSSTLVGLLPKLVAFLQPLDAKLRDIARLVKLCEEWTFSLSNETINLTVIEAPTCTAPFNLTVG